MELISYAQRISKKTEVKGNYSPVMKVTREETYSDKGRVLKRSVVAEVNNAEIMAQYSPYDFKIENLAAVGALQDNKKYTYNPSTIEMMDSVGDAVNLLNDIYDVNNNEEKIDE